ncbi:uncharacterized protein LOC109724445 [Ananas comosus]|uniref:Uncharacterized protein LOC109724445 n=1 Tax=Ananas comosus TaxID=4615 RepID=A0A6P5GLN2_ANACO|nr:uncharacterized protein LOC109724445 [Ananas comosus]
MATRHRAPSCARALVLGAALVWFAPLLALARGACELSVVHRNTLYNYTLASPTPKHPHGVLSEDGFYRVAVNDSILWFQLCDQMIFNHDPPTCHGCQSCGGPLRCGMKCSGLVSNNVGGYDVCTTIGIGSNQQITLIDKNNPQKGVMVKMVLTDCSLSVSVFCDSNVVQLPETFDISGTCDYATALRHPSGCAKAISVSGKGWGWFGTLIMIIICLLLGYILVGTVYRFFFLGIHGVEAIPNLQFWINLPQRARIMISSLIRKLSGRSGDSQGSYARMNY